MPKTAFTPEQVVAKLRQIEVLLSQGKTIALGCKEVGITDRHRCRGRIGMESERAHDAGHVHNPAGRRPADERQKALGQLNGGEERASRGDRGV